jgi:hypothetical protein
VARGGIDERRDDRVVGAAAGPALVERALPGVELLAALIRVLRAPRPVDHLIRRADVAVERMDGRPDLGRQSPRRPEERRIVAQLHPRAPCIGRP